MSASLWGLSNVFAALVRDRLDSWRLLASWQITSVPVIILVAFTVGQFRDLSFTPVIIAIGAGLIATLAYITLFVGLRLGPVAVVSPVIAANGGVGAILAVVFLGEPLSGIQAIGAALATLGVIFVGVRFDNDWRRTRLVGPGVLFALVSMVAFAAQTTALSPASRELGWATAVVFSRLTTAVVILGILALFGGHLRATGSDGAIRALPRRVQVWIGLGGLVSVAGFMAFSIGLETSYAWVIGATSAFAPIVILASSMVLFGERLNRLQWAGIVIVIISVILVSQG